MVHHDEYTECRAWVCAKDMSLYDSLKQNATEFGSPLKEYDLVIMYNVPCMNGFVYRDRHARGF